MWQGTGSTSKWNLSLLQRPSPGSFVWFSLICSLGGGGSTAAAVKLDTVADVSRKKMADGVARSPSRLCNRGGKVRCYGDALSTIFLLACFCALLPTFRFSFFISFSFLIFFPASRYVYLRAPSSVQQPSATLSKYVFYGTSSFCLCHLYPTTPSRNSFVFLFERSEFVIATCKKKITDRLSVCLSGCSDNLLVLV